jgi:tRNA(Ile)-lysidine synthase
MTRSHPPALLRTIERTLLGPCKVGRDTQLAVAVSGGPDSMALLHSLAILQERIGYSLVALSVNHGLRPEAGGEVELVRTFSAGLGVPFACAELSVQPGENLQARAREARYQALFDLADAHHPDSLLATAHHADDRAETVLLRILRGTSPEGLDVLRERDGRLLRPMIGARKRAVLDHNLRHSVPSSDDPSNRAERFLRVRIRHELMPLLTSLSPNVVENLCALADEAGGTAMGLSREQRRQLKDALLNPRRAIDLPLGRGLRLRRDG